MCIWASSGCPPRTFDTSEIFRLIVGILQSRVWSLFWGCGSLVGISIWLVSEHGIASVGGWQVLCIPLKLGTLAAPSLSGLSTNVLGAASIYRPYVQQLAPTEDLRHNCLSALICKCLSWSLSTCFSLDFLCRSLSRWWVLSYIGCNKNNSDILI